VDVSVSIIGLGRLGLPLAAAFASRGVDVIGVDIRQDVVDAANAGLALFHEPGLRELLPVMATTNLEQAVRHTDVTFVIVATPSQQDGAFSLEYVLPACEQIGAALRDNDDYHVVIISSTVMPGSCDGPIKAALEASSGKRAGEDFGLCCVPEFVALGSVVQNFLEPDFVLIGGDRRGRAVVNDVYRKMVGGEPPVLLTNLVNAETAKIALNCYLTTKIAFANQIAGVCERLPGASVNVVTVVLGMDKRINPAYLKGAAPFGGPCFGRDVKALAALAWDVGADSTLTEAVDAANERWSRHIGDVVLSASGGRKAVGVLGLAFKPGTDCTIDALGVWLVKRLRGVRDVYAYDPLVAVDESLVTAQEVVDSCDVAVLTTPDPLWRALAFRDGQTVIDVWRCLDSRTFADAGVHYIGTGLGEADE